MCRWVFRVLPLVVGSGLLVSISFGQTPAEEKPGTAKKPSLMDRFSLTGSKKKDEKAESSSTKGAKSDPLKNAQPAPQLVDMASPILEAERANLLRRQEVCEKLRMIAQDTGDEKLEKMADQLDQMAFDVFRIRTARLAKGMAGPSVEEAVLQSKFGQTSNARLNQAGAGTGSSGQVAARKEK